MSQLKHITKGTGVSVKGRKIEVEGELFTKHREEINRLIAKGIEAIDDGKQDTFTVDAKITIGVIRNQNEFSNNYGNIICPVFKVEENLVLKDEDKNKNEIPVANFEMVRIENCFILVNKEDGQTMMDIEGIEGK